MSSTLPIVEQLKSVAEVLGAFASVALAVIGFIWSRRDEREKVVQRTREMIRVACNEIRIDFALSFFVDREADGGKGVARSLSDGDYQQILYVFRKRHRGWRHWRN